MKKFAPKVMVIITSILLATGAGLFTPSASATGPASPAAVECTGWDFENVDDGSGRLVRGANMKVGPYEACGNEVWIQPGTLVYYWCWVANDYGNTWTFARIAGTQTHGWIYDDHLPTNPDGSTKGAVKHC
ncbi:hypothetical protein [Actinophytocola sediminis]